MANPARRVALLTLLAATGIGVLSPLAADSDSPWAASSAIGLAVARDVPGATGENSSAGSEGTLGSTSRDIPSDAPETLAAAGQSQLAPGEVPQAPTLLGVQPPPPPVVVAPQPPPAPIVVDGSVWDRLAACESGGNWAINTGNGYYGGLQFSYETWHGYGGGEFADYPHLATREQQIIVAERLHAARGFQPWPACRLKLGLP